MNSRVMRLSAAALLAGAAVATLAPHTTNYVSSSAVVNASILVIRAPFDGILTQGSARLATHVGPGQTLLRVNVERQNQDTLLAVEADITATGAEIASLSRQIGSVVLLEAELHHRIRPQGAAALRVVPDDSWPELRLAAVDREALDPQPDPPAQRRAAEDPSEGAYERQRLDEVALLLAQLTSRQSALEGRQAALEEQAATMRTDLAHRAVFEPQAPAHAVIWRAAPQVGSSLAAGDTLMELLDCGNRFVEVSLPGHLFSSIRPGDTAMVLLKGAAMPIPAQVEALAGAGARLDHPDLASDPVEISSSDMRVLVRLEPLDPALPDVAASFCDVGRAAEVRFPRERSNVLEPIAKATENAAAWASQLIPQWTRTSDIERTEPGAL